MKVRARQSGAQQSMFGRMVALVRIKGATRQRGLEMRLRDLGKIWVTMQLHLEHSLPLPCNCNECGEQWRADWRAECGEQNVASIRLPCNFRTWQQHKNQSTIPTNGGRRAEVRLCALWPTSRRASPTRTALPRDSVLSRPRLSPVSQEEHLHVSAANPAAPPTPTKR